MVSKPLPSVTIGIPFHNAEPFLLDAIRSVFAQTHEDWELILMDDGSTDRSLDVARSIKDPRVRVYSDGENKRLASRLNQIHRLAKYDFVARMDADDMMSPKRIERQVSFLVDHPEVDLVSTGVCTISDSGMPVARRAPPIGGCRRLTAREALLGKTGIVHASIVARKDWVLRNAYDEQAKLSQDYKLWVSAALKEDLSVGFIKDPLYYYREEGSVTPQKMLSGYSTRRKALSEHAKGLLPSHQIAAAYASSYFRSGVVVLSRMMGVSKYLVRFRSASLLAEEEAEEIRQKIALVRDH
ncbi:glycosyltransferase family A protein [Luteimonas sp. MC1750]|uniref:glycosyltransferase family 2 protein n=1 Tax=Luteimonas sp. MC1750 TaxID=2799326 RepID=UPI0018F10096|nr:glycosyltransferase family A protein [Luteimonas sp. MC1750]MBJ6984217.1 glycosyltransferase family 2 protein [Luteimonas sp. MC1750]QQO06996.1 glycosyltransferase family 2 protein [Luteimonas sp. MC1750]